MANNLEDQLEIQRQQAVRNTIDAKVEAHQGLTDSEIEVICPVAFKETMSKTEIADLGLSKHYSFVPTSKVINDLRTMGWNPVDAVQIKSRKKSTNGYQKHMVTFENEDYKIDQVKEVETADGKTETVVEKATEYPQLLLTNSHDGRNSFNLHAGLFRLVCANGLIIADTTFDHVKIKHQWYNMEEITKVTNAMMDKIPTIITNINDMDSRELSEKEKRSFVKKAILTRWPKGNEMLDIDDMLQSIRVGDKGNSVWKVYNVIQEKLIKGGLVFNNHREKIQKLRPIINIDRKVDVNKNLWELAESYV